MNFSLRQLEGFAAAVRVGSFTGAAQKVGMTQPAFSQLIRALEGVVGSRLFDRTTRKIKLTEPGRRFLNMIERPLDDLSQANIDVRELAAGTRGRIVIGTLPSVSFGHLARSLAEFKARHPAVVIRLIEGANPDLVESVLNREVDFGIGALTTPHNKLVFCELLRDELVAVYPVGHAISRKRKVSWRELSKQTLILLYKRSSSREVIDRGFAVAGVTAEPAYEIANMVTSLSMVRAGLGVTIMPRMALPALNMQGLRFKSIGYPCPSRAIGIITRIDRPPPPAAAKYIEMLFATVRRNRHRALALNGLSSVERNKRG